MIFIFRSFARPLYNRSYSPGGPVLADKTFETRDINMDTVHSRNTRHVIERKFRRWKRGAEVSLRRSY